MESCSTTQLYRPLRRGMAVMCVAVLLAAGTIHAAHFCGLPGSPGHRQVSRFERAPVRLLCMVCASLHAPSLAAQRIMLRPADSDVGAAVVQQPACGAASTAFALYIRPPPSLG